MLCTGLCLIAVVRSGCQIKWTRQEIMNLRVLHPKICNLTPDTIRHKKLSYILT